MRAFGSYGMIGTGSDILSIERRRNEYYDTKYRSNSCIGGYYDSQIYYMKCLHPPCAIFLAYKDTVSVS